MSSAFDDTTDKFYKDIGQTRQHECSNSPYKDAISVTTFVDDLRARYEEAKKCSQIWVYFYRDKSTYVKPYESTHRGKTFKQDYVYIRPELITLAGYDEHNKPRYQTLKKDNTEIYQLAGIKCKTHVTFKNSSDYQPRSELKDTPVNMLLITNEVKHIQSTGYRTQLVGMEARYYPWEFKLVSERDRVSAHLLKKNRYDNAKQFEPKPDLYESAQSSEDLEILSDDDEDSVSLWVTNDLFLRINAESRGRLAF